MAEAVGVAAGSTAVEVAGSIAGVTAVEVAGSIASKDPILDTIACRRKSIDP
jgi:hypothetical protein